MIGIALLLPYYCLCCVFKGIGNPRSLRVLINALTCCFIERRMIVRQLNEVLMAEAGLTDFQAACMRYIIDAKHIYDFRVKSRSKSWRHIRSTSTPEVNRSCCAMAYQIQLDPQKYWPKLY